MTSARNNPNVHTLRYGDKEILLIGTAHVSRDSVDLVEAVVLEEKPDTV
jgi:pheromone shutdown protein TraB